VIARGRGAVPEIVRHGETGFIVNSIEDAVEAVRHVPTLDRERIRQHVARYFSHDRMVEEYLRVYERILRERAG
jgi:glycosyltransferase involved in cell wall biosynthesis